MTRTYSLSVEPSRAPKVAGNVYLKDISEFGGSYRITRWASNGCLDFRLGFSASLPLPIQVALTSLDAKLEVGYKCKLTITINNGLTWKVENETTASVPVPSDADTADTAAAEALDL